MNSDSESMDPVLSRRLLLGSLTAAAILPKLSMASGTKAQAVTVLGDSPLDFPRTCHTATALRNGRILIVGGYNALANFPTDSVQILDPATGKTMTTSPLRQGRARHSAVLMSDGRVLVSGGIASSVLDTVEVYDPNSGNWKQLEPMLVPRMDHAACLMGSQVLLTGGTNGRPLSSCELYAYSAAMNRADRGDYHVA